MYKYNSEIHYEVENNFIKEKISFAKEQIKQFHDIRNQLMQRLQWVSVEQIKYYNVNYKSKKYVVSDLILLLIKNFKQKRFSKKLSHKFVESFWMKNKIEKQTYRFTLFNIYRIHNTFHVLLLKSYLYRADDAKTKAIMQILKLIDDTKQWKMKEIINKIKSKKEIWYKIKWLNWNHIYDQWLSEEKLKYVSKLKQQFNEKMTSRKRRRKT